jgi:hypothetical protein
MGLGITAVDRPHRPPRPPHHAAQCRQQHLQQQRKQQGPGEAEGRGFEHHGDIYQPADQDSNEVDEGIKQGRQHASMVRIAACAGKPLAPCSDEGCHPSTAPDADSRSEAPRAPRPSLLLLRSSTIQVAASVPAVRLRPELALQLHQAPNPGAVGAEVGLDVGGHLANRCQVDAEQLCAPLQRRRDRPAHVRVVPGPHRARLSNTSSRGDQQRCVVRQGQLRDWVGRAGAATRRNLGDSSGQQGITNLEVSSGFAAIH